MTVVLDTTIGGASANSYSELADIDAFAETAFSNDAAFWAAIEDTADDPTYTKTIYAIRATRILDTIPFSGSKNTLTQALMWPRFGVTAPVAFADYALYGLYYPVDLIPPCVLTAQRQLAVFLYAQAQASEASDPFAGGDAGALSSIKVGPLDINFRNDAGSFPAAGRDYIQREIYPILAAGNVVGSSRGVRLTR